MPGPPTEYFRSPPSVRLCTAEGFSRIEVEIPADLTPGSEAYEEYFRERGLHFGLADVKDCFHRMRQPHWLSKYFVPAFRIKGLPGSEIEGRKVQAHDYVYPMPASLCMGFSWSLYFAQRADENMISKVPSLFPSQLVSAPVVFDSEGKEKVKH